MDYQFIEKKPRKTFNEVTDKNTLKEAADNIMKLGGNIKGDAILNSIAFVRHQKGTAGVAKVKEKMKELGHPLDFSTINKIEWYPESYNILINILYKELFDLTLNDVFSAGRFAAKKSIFLKSFIKYFVSVEVLIKKARDYWSGIFDFGELEIVDVNEKEKHVVIRVRDYNKSSISCVYMAGYFLETLSYVIKADRITAEEKTCAHDGGDYHEYTIKWQ